MTSDEQLPDKADLIALLEGRTGDVGLLRARIERLEVALAREKRETARLRAEVEYWKGRTGD